MQHALFAQLYYSFIMFEL